jgi:uncharacterized protein YeaO (DUF488 family)
MSHVNEDKKIYTSNYARIKQFRTKHPDCYIVGTSVWIPHWFKNSVDVQRLDLAPTWEIVNAIKEDEITWEEYEEGYLKLLEERKINPQQIIDELPNNTFLLCFEKPTDHCHRFLLADWVQEKTGFKITEWMNEKERKAAQKKDNLDSLLDL